MLERGALCGCVLLHLIAWGGTAADDDVGVVVSRGRCCLVCCCKVLGGCGVKFENGGITLLFGYELALNKTFRNFASTQLYAKTTKTQNNHEP